NFLRRLVYAQHFHRDLVAWRDDLIRVGDTGPSHHGDVQNPLAAAHKIDEATEVAHRRDAAGQRRPRHDRLPQFFRPGALLFFEVLSLGYASVLAVVLVLGDTNRIDVPDVHRWLDGSCDVDLRERAKRSLTSDA